MKIPAVGDCVMVPRGPADSFEATIIRVDMLRRQVVASMLVSEEETAFHLTFEDVSKLDAVPAKVAPDPS